MHSSRISLDRSAASFTVALAVFLAGCAVAKAPSDWLPNVEDIPEDAFGAWVEISQSDTTRYGELIALDGDSLYLLPVAPRASKRAKALDSAASSHLDVIPLSAIPEARLFWFDSDWERLALTSLAGTVATVSHGAFLMISSPFWILGGFASSNIHSRKPLLSYPDATWSTFKSYARFPQGLPPDLNHLRPRPRSAD